MNRLPLGCVLDINTRNALRYWLHNFRHSEDIFIDITPYQIEFTVADNKGRSQRMTMPSIYLERGCRMYKIEDLLGDGVC